MLGERMAHLLGPGFDQRRMKFVAHRVGAVNASPQVSLDNELGILFGQNRWCLVDQVTAHEVTRGEQSEATAG